MIANMYNGYIYIRTSYIYLVEHASLIMNTQNGQKLDLPEGTMKGQSRNQTLRFETGVAREGFKRRG